MKKSTNIENTYESENITAKGVRVNNLKNISLEIPRNKLIVVCMDEEPGEL